MECDLPTPLPVQSVLDPAGPAAASIEWLWWVLFWTCTGVFVLVSAGIFRALFHRGARAGDGMDPALHPDDRSTMRWVLGLGVGVSGLILTGLFVHSLVTMRGLGGHGPADLVIEVTGYDWWWEVRYPLAGADTVVTANEIHVPVGADVELRLRSADVIHSVWVPRVAGKADMIPGRTTMLRLRADEEGEMRGQCAEYCGVQHTHMGLLLIAMPPDSFATWLAHQATPAAEPAGDTLAARGRAVLERSQCAACHTVRGTGADGRLGPDLTHIAGRRTLGAGLLRNTHANMAGWIANPQQLKPGVHMPNATLEPLDLRALTAYLMSLR